MEDFHCAGSRREAVEDIKCVVTPTEAVWCFNCVYDDVLDVNSLHERLWRI